MIYIVCYFIKDIIACTIAYRADDHIELLCEILHYLVKIPLIFYKLQNS